jgi:hypothetical protein
VVAGNSFDDGQSFSTHRAVIWDDQGARDVARELLDDGVDLKGRKLGSAERVWQQGSTLRVFGWALDPLDSTRWELWFAELPAR